MALTTRTLSSLILAVLLLAGPDAKADVPRTLTVQGQVLTSAGAPANSPVTVVLKLYATETSTLVLYSQSLGSVTLQDGVFDAALGPIPDGVVESAAALWLETVADGVVLPRQPLRSVPWAIIAQRALVAGDVSCSGCIGATDVQFLYAGSSSVGGAALDLDCGPACVGAAEIEDGAVKASHLQGSSVTPDKLSKVYAGSDTAGGPAKDVACTGCIGGADIEANVTLSGNVKTSGSLTACTAGAGGCGIVVGAAALVPPGDGWLDLQVTEGLRVRGPGGSGYRPIEFAGGTSTGSLEIQGGLTTIGSVGVGTTSPQEKLHVAGNLLVDGTISSKSALDVDGNITYSGVIAHDGYDQRYDYPFYRMSHNQVGDISGTTRINWNNNSGVRWSVYRTIYTGTVWSSRDAEEKEILTAMGMSGAQHFQPNIIVAKVVWDTALSWVSFPNQIWAPGTVTYGSYCKSTGGALLNYYWATGMTTSWGLCGSHGGPYAPGTYIHAHPNSSGAGSALVIWPAVVAGRFPLEKANPKWGYWPYQAL